MDNPNAWRDTLGDVALTDRQLEVLRLKARRQTNAEIADKLVITITTVKWHVRQIYNKLGVNNRAEAVTSARQLGLLEQKSKHKKGPRYNFPIPLTPFVGRAQEQNQLTALLADPGARLITLIGPGGIGKTRLALHAAGSLDGHFADGICWVAFSGLDKAELVFTTVDEYIAENIINALGLTLQGAENPIRFLQSHLANRNFLIILDSFEALIAGASFISDLLAETQNCKFLITSRERLKLPGEVLFPIQGLAHVRQDGGEAGPVDAVALFTQAANRVANDDFTSEDHLSAIQHLCQRLEGMPLAIELAAEWTRLLPVGEIEQELDHGLAFLDSGSTSIRSVFDRSWKLLTDHQRISFSRLAVFQRGFSREAAKKVAGADLETLTALFDKSLIQKIDEGRYTLHDLLRQYAAEKLDAIGDWAPTRGAHCAYFAALVADQRESILRGDYRKITADLDNIRSAWRWAVSHRRLADLNQMMFPLDWFYILQADYSQGMAAMRLAVDALHMSQPEGLQGIIYGKALVHYSLELSWLYGREEALPFNLKGLDVLRTLGSREDLAWPLILSVAYQIQDVQVRKQSCLESLEIFEELNDPYGIAYSSVFLGIHYMFVGKYLEAQGCIERGLAISRSINDPEGTALALHYLGDFNLYLGHQNSARQYYREETKLWYDLSLRRKSRQALKSIGTSYWLEGKLEKAKQLYLETLVEFEQLGDPGNTLTNLINLVNIALQQGRTKEANDYLHDAAVGLERMNDLNSQVLWWLLSGRISLLQGNLEEAHLNFCRALKARPQKNSTVVIAFLDFAFYYHKQADHDTAARLLGFVQTHTWGYVILMQSRIDHLCALLSELIDENRLGILLEEGASRKQQDLINSLLAECG